MDQFLFQKAAQNLQYIHSSQDNISPNFCSHFLAL
jgi:hypothetical protein